MLVTGNKTVIPDDAINLHKSHLADLKNIGAIAKSQDLAKFNSQDFLFFLKIRGYFFKNIGNYEGLKPSLEKASLSDTKILVIPIMKNYEIFEKLAPIIGLSENKVNPKTFANIIQYLALKDRHRDSYREYAKLTKTLKNWKKIYDSIILVREQYNPEEYKIPTEFKEELVGEEIFNKYKSYLM